MDRVIALEGGRNFRDLGGYKTQDGRRVKWRTLFRSGSMARLTPADYETLARFSIQRVYDFRTTVEREMEPNAWAEAANIVCWSRDYEISFGDLRRVITSPEVSADIVRNGMIEGYRELPYEQAASFKALFQGLAAQETPLVFNCSAGKDRAGTAAALVLTALGVDQDIVLEDYLLTNQVLDLNAMIAQRVIAVNKTDPVTDGGMEIAALILHTQEHYLRAAFDAIEERSGGVLSYLRDELDVSADTLGAIRAHLLAPAL